MKTMLDAALVYLDMGYSVIPLKPKDKVPVIKWQGYQTNRATEDEAKKWFEHGENNIGIVTGQISGLSVLDIDGPEALKLAKSKGLPETRLIKTGKQAGWHCYYKYEPGLRNWQARNDLPGIDIRSDGGYVVAPPSIHPNGSQYKIIKDIVLNTIPIWILNTNTIYNKGEFLQNLQNLQPLFSNGRRDIDLFHISNCLVKGGCEKEYICEVLKRLINSWGENDDKWISDKINSALNRDERREVNIIAEVKEFLSLTESYISLTDILQTLTKLTPHRNALYQAMHRLVKEGYLEKHPTRHGTYRRIKKDFELMNYRQATGKTVHVNFPLDLDHFVRLYPGNIILLAGAKNSGKTTFMLDFIRQNQEKNKILYINSEMGEDELNARLELFEDMKINDWKFDAVELNENYQDLIDPEKYPIFIIDYLEVLENFYEVGKYISAIHSKLKNSICLIGIQKKTDSDVGRGGEFTLEKPRLALAMDYGRIKIVKCKAWVKGWENPNGKIKEFKIVNGSKFLPTTTWYYDGEKKKTLIRQPGEEG